MVGALTFWKGLSVSGEMHGAELSVLMAGRNGF